MRRYTYKMTYDMASFYLTETLTPMFQVDHIQPSYAQFICDALNEKEERDALRLSPEAVERIWHEITKLSDNKTAAELIEPLFTVKQDENERAVFWTCPKCHDIHDIEVKQCGCGYPLEWRA